MPRSLVFFFVMLSCICGSARIVLAQAFQNESHHSPDAAVVLCALQGQGICHCCGQGCPCSTDPCGGPAPCDPKKGMVATNSGCVTSCQAEAQSLKDQDAALWDLFGDFQKDLKMQQIIYKEYTALSQRWNALKASCPSIGNLPYGFGDPSKWWPPPPQEPGLEPDPLGNGIVGAIGGGIADVGWDAGKAGLTGAAGAVGDFFQDDALNAGIKGALFGVGVEVGNEVGNQVIEKAGQSGDSGGDSKSPEMLRTGKSMLKSRAGEVIAVDNYLKASQGYRTAAAAKDAAAMDVNLQAALAAITTAKEQSRQAAVASTQLELQLQNLIDQGLANLQKSGVSVQNALAQWQKAVKQHGLPPELVSQLQADGIPAAKISELRKRALSITPAQYEAVVQTQRDRLKLTQMMNTKLAAAKSGATWPEPPEIGQLELLEHQTLALLQPAKQ